MPAGRLRVGECTVDFSLREIHAPSARRPMRVTPKTIAVLSVLIEQVGRVVSREALLAQVWPGTLPTNDVVTQAITQLRKAFDDERGNPRYIETIAKHGYRLLAPVEPLEDAPPPSPFVTGQLPALPAAEAVPAAAAEPSRKSGPVAGAPARRPWRTALADFDTVEPGQHEVEHDNVVTVLRRQPVAVQAVGRVIDLEAAAFEELAHHFGNIAVVLDDQDQTRRLL